MEQEISEITLTKEQKVLMLEILKRGKMTKKEAVEIQKPMQTILTKEQIDKFVEKL